VSEDDSTIASLIGVLMFRRRTIEQWDNGAQRETALVAIDDLISDLEAGDVPESLS